MLLFSMKVRLENLIDYNTLKSLLPFFYHANVFFIVNVVMMKSEFILEKFGHLIVFGERVENILTTC